MEVELSIQSKETGATETKRLHLNGRLTLGRGPESPVVLDGNGLSREHLAFQSTPAGFEVVDLSSNGTWLNGRRLPPNQPQPATAADRIEIPGYAIRCQPIAPPAPQSEAGPLAPGRRLTTLELWTVALALAALLVLTIFLRL